MITRTHLFLLGILLTGSFQGIWGQSLIAVHHNGNATFYKELDSAMNVAQAGDTLYLPGQVYDLTSPLIIDKQVHLVGTGHHPDSTAATGRTRMNGEIRIVTGADYGSIAGIYAAGSIYFGSNVSDNDVHHFTIGRCHIAGFLLFSFNGTVDADSIGPSHIIVRNSLVGDYFWGGGFTTDNLFYNNIFKRDLGYFNERNRFLNNVFSGSKVANLNRCEFANNYFSTQYTPINAGSVTNCSFKNNLFRVSSGTWGPSNEYYGNIFLQTLAATFVDPVGNPSLYDVDYRLLSTSPGKNAGTDGTDIGIYGGLYPWKDNTVPFNPHIQSRTIGPTTDGAGNLPVNIKVKAQDY